MAEGDRPTTRQERDRPATRQDTVQGHDPGHEHGHAAPAAKALPDASYSAVVLAVATAVAALLLQLLGALLQVPGGWGIEDLLGWPDARGSGGAQGLIGLWSQTDRSLVAWLVLGLDSALFVPLYASLGLAVAIELARALGGDAIPAQREARERLVLTLLVPPVLLLMLVDLAENSLGLARLGKAGPGVAVATAVIALAAVPLRGRLRLLLARLGRRALPITGAAALLLVLGNGWAAPACTPFGQRGVSWISALGCGAHGLKPWLSALAVALPAVVGLVWLSGLAIQAEVVSDRRLPAFSRRRSDTPPSRHDERVLLRAAVRDIVLRSRYVLLALALLGGLLLKLEAPRDALYALAASPLRGGEAAPAEQALRALGTLGAFTLTAAALWALLLSCWIWTRGASELQRARGALTSLPIAPGQYFVRLWTGVLAFMPAVLLALLCTQVLRETAMAQSGASGSIWASPAPLLLVCGLGALVLGVIFLARRPPDAGLAYYDTLTWPEWAAQAGLLSSPESRTAPRRWRLPRRVAPQALLPLLLVGLLLCRAIDLLPAAELLWERDRMPSLGLAATLLAVALWLSVFGWLSLLEIHGSRPWIGLPLLALLGLGVLGWTGQDGVWPAITQTRTAAAGGLRMLGFTALLGSLLLLAQAGGLWLARRHEARSLRTVYAGLGLLGLMVLALLVLGAADFLASTRTPARREVLAADRRPTLDTALAEWLQSLCGPGPGRAAERGDPPAAEGEDASPAPAPLVPCQPALPLDAQGALRVYLVASEGTGLRAAAWTGFVLQHLAQQDEQLLHRTFAITGVSGGAVGAAALRGCLAGGRLEEGCLERLAHADLMSPLLAAGLFEAPLQGLLPSAGCALPGCGFLSGTAWFEQALEAGSPGLRQGLMASRGLAAAPGAHVPYLLLGATWLRTGERAIASDLRIDWRQFPGARDQLGLTGRDLPLGSVAHNAARSGPLLAPGLLRAPHERCLDRASADGAAPRPASGRPQPCGLLADGSVADPGATQTSIDLLQALGQCLATQSGAAGQALYPRCAALDGAQRAWLRERLLPQLLVLRDHPPPPVLIDAACAPLDQRPPTAAELVALQPRAACGTDATQPLPGRPLCPGPNSGMPARTWHHAEAESAEAALAQARQVQAVSALRDALGGLARASAEPPVRTLDLAPEGIRYAAGWHLPALAVERMWQQARGCTQGAWTAGQAQ
ncbi:hypothetical protein [Azohydromonas caseinilytica]|uniref:Patatin-like phospholipase n=1 Tax=Azohydromonas caseinilytica TaxID=2728836 RepID=A0A848FCT3_9BURK|nr:hypothetical protein [Azohydromonas caseinilytica]NML16595.1 hypothetical protein [Azohydromonas caseinilytica]